jgi:luciferase family oxidoreductase group 1
MPSPPLSVLDLVPVRAGSAASEAMRESVALAQVVERLGYVRYWFAEHHSMGSIASSAPEILIGHIASATSRIRVGSGGIMLPNHSPLRVAEVFHTLEALHPGRIDLGIGRAPGTDPATSRALRPFDGEQFPDLVREMVALSHGGFPADHPFASIRVIPNDVTLPPIWVLASSGATAAFAGSMGMGYGFARHFSPNPPGPAIRAYRAAFRPSAQFPAPHVVLGVSVICAPTDEEAEYMATSTDLGWVRLHRKEFGPVPSPEEASRYVYSPQERVIVEANRQRHFIGTPAKVASLIRHAAEDTDADEIMVTTMTYGRAERVRSYELLATEWT